MKLGPLVTVCFAYNTRFYKTQQRTTAGLEKSDIVTDGGKRGSKPNKRLQRDKEKKTRRRVRAHSGDQWHCYECLSWLVLVYSLESRIGLVLRSPHKIILRNIDDSSNMLNFLLPHRIKLRVRSSLRFAAVEHNLHVTVYEISSWTTTPCPHPVSLIRLI